MSSEFYDQVQTINPELLGEGVSTPGADPVRDSASVVTKKTKLSLKKKILFGAGAIVGLIVMVVLLVAVGIIPVPPDPEAQNAPHPGAAQNIPKNTHPVVPPAPVETAPQESEQAQPAEQNQTVMGDAPAEKTSPTPPVNGSQKGAAAPAAQAVGDNTGAAGANGQAGPVSDAAVGALTARQAETNARMAKIENQLMLLSSQMLSLKEELKTANSSNRSVSANPDAKPTQPSVARVSRPINNTKVSPVRSAPGRSAGNKKGLDDSVGVITESKSSVDTSGKVQILGITSKAGGGYVVLSFAGIKKRYERGESVPALGRITDFGSDNGIPYVEIAGVTYR